jgi:hypothetical protein
MVFREGWGWEKNVLFEGVGKIWLSEGLGQKWLSGAVGSQMAFRGGGVKNGFPRGWGQKWLSEGVGSKMASEGVGSKMAFRGMGIHSFPRANMAFRPIHTQTQESQLPETLVNSPKTGLAVVKGTDSRD